MKKLISVMVGLVVLGMTSVFAQNVLKPVASKGPFGETAPDKILVTNNSSEDFTLFVNVWHQEIYNSWDKSGNSNGGFKQQYLMKRYEVVIPAGTKDSVVDFSDLPALEGNDYYWFGWTNADGVGGGAAPYQTKSITIDKKGKAAAK